MTSISWNTSYLFNIGKVFLITDTRSSWQLRTKIASLLAMVAGLSFYKCFIDSVTNTIYNFIGTDRTDSSLIQAWFLLLVCFVPTYLNWCKKDRKFFTSCHSGHVNFQYFSKVIYEVLLFSLGIYCQHCLAAFL